MRRLALIIVVAVHSPAVAQTGGLAAPPPSAASSADRAQDAATALVRGNTQQAIADYTEALKDTGLPNDRRSTILNDRGVAYVRLGQTKLAIDDFNRAAQLFPEYAAVYNNRGNLLLALGLHKEAIKDFDRAIILAPGYAAAFSNRAGAYVKLGQYADAIKDYTKAIELMPASATPLSGRGRAFLSVRRPHAAIRDFTRAVNADARFASGYRNRAEAKLDIARYEEAIEDLSRAIAFDINNAEIYVLRGHAYLAMANPASAIKDFSRALELDAKSAAAYSARGLAHGLAEAFEEAFADLNRAIELDPRSAEAFAYRAVVYKQNGQVDIGQKDVETAVKLDADRAEVHWAKAEIEEARGQIDQAVADLRQALSLKPGFKLAADALQRIAGDAADPQDKPIAGLELDKWRVVARGKSYFAVNDQFPRLRIPLEMSSEGQPRLLEWEMKKAPLKGIGILRFHGGVVEGKAGREEVEFVAIVDLSQGSVIAIEPHRQGDKVATWTWQEDRVVVASVDGATDEFMLSSQRFTEAQGSQRRYTNAEQQGPFFGWAPWSQPMAGPRGSGQNRPQRRKPKTLFDLLFN